MKKFDYVEILKPDTTEENIEKHIEKIIRYLKNKSCQNIEVEKLGIKNLAYTIKGNEKGFYILYHAKFENLEEYKKIEKYLYNRNANFAKTYPEVIKNISAITDDDIKF